MRSDDQQRVHALDGNDSQQTRERAPVGSAEGLVELAHHALDVGALQGEKPDRHSGDPVDVEHVDRLQQVAQLELGAGKDEHVAQIVDTELHDL